LIYPFCYSTINNVAKLNHLAPNSNYHFFKQGVRPEWEDESNAKGGKFTITFPKNKAGETINEYWTYLLSNYLFSIHTKGSNDSLISF
jgi:translation initiation factor 4E